MHRVLVLLFGGLVMAAGSWLLPVPDEDTELARATERLQERVNAASVALRKTVAAMTAELEHHEPEHLAEALYTELAERQERDGIELLVLHQDTVAFWSGKAAAEGRMLSREAAGHVVLPDGVYLHAEATTGPYRVHGLRSIWYAPSIENRYLHRAFHPSLGADPGIMAILGPGTGGVVRDGEGGMMFRAVHDDRAPLHGRQAPVRLVLLLCGIAFLIASFWLAMDRLADSQGMSLPLLLLAGLLVLIRWPMIAWEPIPGVNDLPMFDPGAYATSAIFPSLGDLLLNALFLGIWCAFLHRRVRLHIRSVDHLPRKLVLTSLAPLLVAAAGVSELVEGLVRDSRIELDPQRIQFMDARSFAALLAAGLLFGGWMLLADAWARAAQHARNRRPAALALAIAAGISVVVHHTFGIVDTALMAWPLALAALSLTAHIRGRFLWPTLLALAVLSAFNAHVFQRAGEQRLARERDVLAERLLDRDDPVVELLFRETAPAIRRDERLYDLLTRSGSCEASELDRIVRQERFLGYWERYDVRLYGYGPNGAPRCATDAEPPHAASGPLTALDDRLAAADMPDLHRERPPGQRAFLHARVAVMPNDSAVPAQLIIELHPRMVAEGLGFPEVLMAGSDAVDQRADRFIRGRYEDGILVENASTLSLPLRWTHPPGAAVHLAGHTLHTYGGGEGVLLVLGAPTPSWSDRITSFSYLFVWYALLLALVLALVALTQGVLDRPLSVGGKIRLALISFSIIGLLFFGVGTRRLISRAYAERSTAALIEKTRSIHVELQRKLAGTKALPAPPNAYLDHVLARLSNVFFTDIHLYLPTGRLLSSSRPQLFASGLVGRRMEPRAWNELVRKGSSMYVHRETLGSAEHRVAYMPLRDMSGSLLGYIALPSFADQALQDRERAEVFVAVANLFVVLFVMSVLMAVFISNWTTRPLDILRNALARVGLRETNEPIRYRGDDEIGQLVEVYNNKVEELRESAERLARSERESAWREMARQVAHEIKNPLTPMKLSIQHFQRTWTPDAPDAAEKLERFSKGMVEQIDSLSGIASAFSNFAQMPRARAEDLDLVEVAEAAMSMFHATPGMHCELRRGNTGPLPVHADREQLLRVFNNLLKNAVQSIPDGQEGRITVVLRQADGEAIAEVHDNGTGITEEDRERIFQPNFTTKSSGMGLGLAMVQRMVEGAGGRVWFESRVGKGSTFFVALPLRG